MDQVMSNIVFYVARLAYSKYAVVFTLINSLIDFKIRVAIETGLVCRFFNNGGI